MPIHPNDTATFTDIYHEYFTRLFHFAQRFVDKDDAADVLSEVFIGLWRSSTEFRDDKALSVYLYRSVRNRCVSRLQKMQPMRDIPDVPYEVAIDQSEIIVMVLEGVADLPKRQQQVIKMHWLEGKSFKAIAAQVGREYNTIKSINAAAIKTLRKIKI